MLEMVNMGKYKTQSHFEPSKKRSLSFYDIKYTIGLSKNHTSEPRHKSPLASQIQSYIKGLYIMPQWGAYQKYWVALYLKISQ